MNMYKKTLLIIGMALAATQAQGMSTSDLKTFLKNEVLSPAQQTQNLFNQTNEQIFNNLATAYKIIEGYIFEEAGGDSTLMQALVDLNQERKDLAKGIEVGHKLFVDHPYKLDPETYYVNRDRENRASLISNHLKNIKSSVSTRLQTLKSITFYLSKKKTAQALLELFGSTIIIIAGAAQEDLNMKQRNPLDEFPNIRHEQDPTNAALIRLGLNPNSFDPDKIRAAYDRLTKKWRPDLTTEPDKEYARQVFMIIQNAFEYLIQGG